MMQPPRVGSATVARASANTATTFWTANADEQSAVAARATATISKPTAVQAGPAAATSRQRPARRVATRASSESCTSRWLPGSLAGAAEVTPSSREVAQGVARRRWSAAQSRVQELVDRCPLEGGWSQSRGSKALPAAWQMELVEKWLTRQPGGIEWDEVTEPIDARERRTL